MLIAATNGKLPLVVAIITNDVLHRHGIAQKNQRGHQNPFTTVQDKPNAASGSVTKTLSHLYTAGSKPEFLTKQRMKSSRMS